jgi:hypothetical protein
MARKPAASLLLLALVVLGHVAAVSADLRQPQDWWPAWLRERHNDRGRHGTRPPVNLADCQAFGALALNAVTQAACPQFQVCGWVCV